MICFASDYNIDRILLTIGAITGVNIEAGNTLIIMDEFPEFTRQVLEVMRQPLELESDDYDSLGGYLIGQFDHVPNRGETFVNKDGVSFRVDSVGHQRIEKVQINFHKAVEFDNPMEFEDKTESENMTNPDHKTESENMTDPDHKKP